MTGAARNTAQLDEPAGTAPPMPPVPRIAVAAFCETRQTMEAVAAAARDRHMARAKVETHQGGITAARQVYSETTSPNVIVVETTAGRDETLAALDGLAEVCHVDTKVIVIGHVNDIKLYRELVHRGVSDYLVAPVAPLDLVTAVASIFGGAGTAPIGRTIAVVGAKGGCGASIIAHNLAAAIARDFTLPSLIVDLDMAFGTAGLDLNQDPPQGVAEALAAPDRIDANFLDRLMAKCADNLNLLAAPALVDRPWDLEEAVVDRLLETLRATNPVVVLDVPHVWTSWTRRTLVDADAIVLVAAPDLANLRNAKNLMDMLRQARPSDRPPYLVLNQVGLPKRPEIAAAEFAKALDVEPTATIAFDAHLFGTAANNGQMLHEIQPAAKATAAIQELAAAIMGRTKASAAQSTFLQPFLAKLAGIKARR
jgi:pilus assembly protein CpaE